MEMEEFFTKKESERRPHRLAAKSGVLNNARSATGRGGACSPPEDPAAPMLFRGEEAGAALNAVYQKKQRRDQGMRNSVVNEMKDSYVRRLLLFSGRHI